MFCQVVLVVACTATIVVIHLSEAIEVSFIEAHIQKVAKVTVVSA